MEARAAVIKQPTTPSVDVALVPAAAVAPESCTKRKGMNDGGHNHHQQQHQSSNKRRKKNNKSNNSKSHHNSKCNNHAIKKKSNWIENCSETIHRIPTNCQAPLTCVITRAETDEEPLLPKGVGINFHNEEVGLTAKNEENLKKEKFALDEARKGGRVSPVNECTTMVYDGGAGDSTDVTNATTVSDNKINIARPSASFVAQYVKEREITLKGVLSSTAVRLDMGKETEKLFIPVKRHVSAIGPTKVSSILILSISYLFHFFLPLLPVDTHTVASCCFLFTSSMHNKNKRRKTMTS
jgi:hypothetical protein